MANILLTNQPFVNVGLVTLTHTIEAAGLYNVACQADEVPPSGLTIVVNQNGSPVYTNPVITPTQISQQFKTSLNCALNDVITVVMTSAAAIDSQLNNVKTRVSLGQGA